MTQKVVTRFAPSPTGFLHVGSIRTAIYAWAFARKHGGTFILRIEDTDKEREVEGSVKHIIESLWWLGITWDEGPEKDGPHAPYIQSQRLELYKEYALKLLDAGHAYPDPYTPEELEALRQTAEAEKRPFLFREHRPETHAPWDGTRPLRFKVPHIKRYEWEDIVRGHLSAGEEALDDFILIKSDGYPTYNFSHVVDDIEMGVTHVIRGEEFISSTPKFLSLYDALGLTPPQFATAPVILGPDGKKKLSKRDGAKDVLEYRTEGYLPEAMVNFLALLGWHPEGDEEVMSISELTEKFDLSRLQKGGAQFDETKLRWINQQHLKSLPQGELLAKLQALRGTLPPYATQVIGLVQERAHTLSEAAQILEEEFSFLAELAPYEASLLLNEGKIPAAEASQHLQLIAESLERIPDEEFTAEKLKDALWPYATAHGRGAVLWPMRVALSGKDKSPDPFTIGALIGKTKTLARIAQARESL